MNRILFTKCFAGIITTLLLCFITPSYLFSDGLLSLNKPSEASSTWDQLYQGNSDWRACLAFDEIGSTRWCADGGGFPQWLKVDLEESRDITRCETVYEFPAKYYQYTIEYSSDNTSWQMFADKQSNTQPGNPSYVDTKSVKGRYVRITTTGAETGSWASIFEFRVIGPGGIDIPSITGRFNLNPVVPGHFADPTIHKFGDCYYIYATTSYEPVDDSKMGPPLVIKTKDFVNYEINELVIDKNGVHTQEEFWAPCVIKENDTYFLYYTVYDKNPVGGKYESNIVATAANPEGPYTCKSVITYGSDPNIAHDPQVFIDDDGTKYIAWGGAYVACVIEELNDDMVSVKPNTAETILRGGSSNHNFAEGIFIFKKDGVYYATYSVGSCIGESYSVHYATSDNIKGPYTYKGPILQTSLPIARGPGHHALLVENDTYYMIYHKLSYDQPSSAFRRQICIDRMTFDTSGDINRITPSLKADSVDIISADALTKKKEETLSYSDYAYTHVTTSGNLNDNITKPEYAVDFNHFTRWAAQNTASVSNPQWLQVDLGDTCEIKAFETAFLVLARYHQYKILHSNDGSSWTPCVDKSGNTSIGLMYDTLAQPVSARYIKIEISKVDLDLTPGIWDFRIIAYEPTPVIHKKVSQDMVSCVNIINYKNHLSINYSLPFPALVNAVLYNSKGVTIKTFVKQKQKAGTYAVRSDITQEASGIYYCKFRINNTSVVKKIIVSK